MGRCELLEIYCSIDILGGGLLKIKLAYVDAVRYVTRLDNEDSFAFLCGTY